MTIIEAKGLCCKIGSRYLLKDIDWQIEKGQHWVVFGENGSGKTTLLSIIAGFNAQTHGSLKVFGQEYGPENILDFRRKIGFISSSFFDKALSRESALDIVLSGKFGTLSTGYGVRDQDVKKAKTLLGELRLRDKVNRPFDLLSKGERQNVLIARALMGQPEVLVLDEPGTGLDIFARQYLLSTIKDLAENTQMTIIYVTHYPEEILPNLEHCLLMKAGRVYASGQTQTLFTSESLSALLEYPVQIKPWEEHFMVELAVDSRIKEML